MQDIYNRLQDAIQNLEDIVSYEAWHPTSEVQSDVADEVTKLVDLKNELERYL